MEEDTLIDPAEDICLVIVIMRVAGACAGVQSSPNVKKLTGKVWNEGNVDSGTRHSMFSGKEDETIRRVFDGSHGRMVEGTETFRLTRPVNRVRVNGGRL